VNGRLIAGRYELATLIGQGGMGQVWTADDRRLERRVAVKLLRPDLAVGGPGEGDELRRRFARECRVTARVEHPGLVAVHDAGSDGDDLYLVMQYVQGADLADHLAEHDPYPWTWAVAVAAQLCPVLAAVHAVPVVHRDLKPRNLIVRPDGTVVLLDLGIAAVLDADTTRLTLTGAPIGSPAYMAPEQVLGGEVGPQADLYTLGVVLHELLSGTVPFSGGSALGVLHRHLHEAPMPLRQVRPEVPEPLEALVLRLLAKDPRDRPPDARAVYRELAPLLPGPSVAEARRGLRGDGPMDPTRPFRRPAAPWPEHRPEPTTPAPTTPAASVPAQPAAPPLEAVPARREDVAAAVDEVRLLLEQGRITQAVVVLGAALPTAAAVHGRHSAVVRMLRKQYAATLMEDGRFELALPELRLLAEDRITAAGASDPQALRFRYEAALCLEQLGDAGAALAEYRALLPHLDQQAAADPVLPLEVRRRAGQLLVACGDHSGARMVLAHLRSDAERLYGPHHSLVAEAGHMLERLVRLGG
jgi:tetratricopeptide (TPR) repeat protein